MDVGWQLSLRVRSLHPAGCSTSVSRQQEYHSLESLVKLGPPAADEPRTGLTQLVGGEAP